jgi:hypothetical protein
LDLASQAGGVVAFMGQVVNFPFSPAGIRLGYLDSAMSVLG